MSLVKVTGLSNLEGTKSLTTDQIIDRASCVAWVNFNGTTNVGGNCTKRASFNVSSVTDNGTGKYTINFATAMPDANYVYTHAYSSEVNVQHTIGFLSSQQAASLSLWHYNVTDSTKLTDKAWVSVAVFR